MEHLGRRREIPSTRFLSKYDLAIYLIKRFTPLSLSEIGELFKMDYSAVSQAAKRFEQKSEVNHEIKEVMQRVITALKEV